MTAAGLSVAGPFLLLFLREGGALWRDFVEEMGERLSLERMRPGEVRRTRATCSGDGVRRKGGVEGENV